LNHRVRRSVETKGRTRRTVVPRRRSCARRYPDWVAAGSLLVASLVSLAGCTGDHRANGSTSPTLRVLQLNLCNSGVASCYTGRSVTTAAALIADEQPDVVTLNEICRDDVPQLQRSMSVAHPGRSVETAFKADPDRPTNGPYRCANGQEFGIGVLAAVPASASDDRVYGDVYPIQDSTDPEERVWLCVHAGGAFYACVTHAASESTSTAVEQCRYFLQSAVPTMRRDGGDDPVILGADLNLPAHHSPGPQSCLSHGYQLADDGARQDVITSSEFAVRSRAVISMRGTTDHPALLVDLIRPTSRSSQDSGSGSGRS
jgi:endonuclease/exonuclease/phosphatase family metal-dependent hydrolase